MARQFILIMPASLGTWEVGTLGSLMMPLECQRLEFQLESLFRVIEIGKSQPEYVYLILPPLLSLHGHTSIVSRSIMLIHVGVFGVPDSQSPGVQGNKDQKENKG